MADQVKNVLIGMFVLAALAIIVFIILFLHPTTGDEGQVLYVRFADIDKINVGTRVTFAGKPVGEVVDIVDITQARTGASDEYGHLYIYELKLLIDSHVKVYKTDQISARTSGLLGEKSVAIMPIALKPGEVAELVQPGEVLYATETGSVEDTMKEFKEVADKFDIALEYVAETLEEIQKEKLVKKIADTAQNLSEITAAINKPDELDAIVNNLQDFTSTLATRIPASWDTIDEALGSFSLAADNFRKTAQNVDQVIANVHSGQGTLGKIMVDEDFYLRLTSLFNKGETILNDINHYGVLFHTDKGWQRLRARRMNLMERLSTPQEFRNYFNDEIDQISTSLSRVAMVLDKVQFCQFECGCPIEQDIDFSKVFAELLRRVATMEEALKLYNQQLMDCHIYETELPRECR